MLVLSRKVGEKVVVGEVVVTVLEVWGNRVKLGVEAPAAVSILREELVGKGGAQAREGFAVLPAGGAIE